MALGPLPDAAQIVQVRIAGTKNAFPWQNTLYLQYTGIAPAVADLNSVAATIGTAWNTNLAPLCDTTVIQDAVTLADLTNRGAAATQVTGQAHAGTRAGTVLPNQVALVISWKINRRYKGGHPRSYLPAGVQADVTAGRTWVSAFVTAATNAAGAFRTALNGITVSGTTYKMVGMNFYSHNPTTHALIYVIPPVPYTVQNAVVHTRVDTQRRRLGKEAA